MPTSNVITKTRDDLKPPKSILKLPETSHTIFFLIKASYSQVVFALVLRPKVFFGQI